MAFLKTYGPWHVRIISQKDFYGRDFGQVYQSEEPSVEFFWDTPNGDLLEDNKKGAFADRYLATTILSHEQGCGLALQGWAQERSIKYDIPICHIKKWIKSCIGEHWEQIAVEQKLEGMRLFCKAIPIVNNRSSVQDTQIIKKFPPPKPVAELRKHLAKWLKQNELDYDLTIYPIKKWRKRKEPFFNDAALVLTFEGSFYHYIHNCDSAEFEELVEFYGYYFEFGHSWNMGFYPLEINNTK